MELPLFSQVTIESFLYQERLRASAQTEDYRVISRAKPFKIPAVVHYVKSKINTVLISGKNMIGQQRIYEGRIH